MSDQTENEGNLSEELRALGENLIKTLRSVWESPELKKLQEEMEEGLNQLGTTLKEEASSFKESPTGQQLKSDFEDLRQRVRSGELEAKAREELLNTLRMVNAELDKAATRWSRSNISSEDEQQPPSS
jgi:hypothetical protein